MSTTHLCTVPEELIDTPPDTCSSRSSFAEDGRLSRASCAKDVEEPDDAHGDLSQLVVCLFPSLHDMAQRMTRMFREHLAGQPVCNRLVATSTPACDDTLQQWRDVCKAVMDSGHIRYAIQLAAAYANNKTHTLLLECRPSFPEGVFVLYATGIRAFASADVTLFASVSFKSVFKPLSSISALLRGIKARTHTCPVVLARSAPLPEGVDDRVIAAQIDYLLTCEELFDLIGNVFGLSAALVVSASVNVKTRAIELVAEAVVDTSDARVSPESRRFFYRAALGGQRALHKNNFI